MTYVESVALPEDSESLKAMVRSLALERDRETQRAEEQRRLAEEQRRLAEEQQRRAEELRVEMLWLQLELERFKKWYYGPRADRLQSSGEVAQMLLDFAAAWICAPSPLVSQAGQAYFLRKCWMRSKRPG